LPQIGHAAHDRADPRIVVRFGKRSGIGFVGKLSLEHFNVEAVTGGIDDIAESSDHFPYGRRRFRLHRSSPLRVTSSTGRIVAA
jgi:hypothetical protein